MANNIVRLALPDDASLSMFQDQATNSSYYTLMFNNNNWFLTLIVSDLNSLVPPNPYFDSLYQAAIPAVMPNTFLNGLNQPTDRILVAVDVPAAFPESISTRVLYRSISQLLSAVKSDWNMDRMVIHHTERTIAPFIVAGAYNASLAQLLKVNRVHHGPYNTTSVYETFANVEYFVRSKANAIPRF